MHQNASFSTTVVRVELKRLVSGTVDRMLECGSRLVGAAADQPLLSGCGRWPRIVQSEGCIRMPLSLLLSCVSVELARLVGGAVVVRVADRRHAAVGQALHTTVHLERARHFVDHPSSTAFFPSNV